MTDNAPSLDQWRSLFEKAALVKKMAPWSWMEEIDLFGVQDPDSGTVDFVSIMGMAGEHFAVALYRGPRALHDFLELHDAPPIESPEQIMEVPQLQLSFEDRDFLDDEDLRLIKKLGLRFRGANAWPQFRAYHPGFFPWFLEAEEARLLDLALEQVLDVAPRFDHNSELLFPEIPKTFLVRVLEGGSWRDRYLPIPPPEPTTEAVLLDPFTLSRFQKLAPSSHILEVDLFHFWSPVKEEEDDRPYYPYVLALVDADSGMIVSFDMLPPLPSLEEMRRTVPQHLLEQFEQIGGLPQEVRVRSPQLYKILGPAAEGLSISLKLHPSLPFLEQVKEHLTQAASAGFDPSMIPVDFAPGGAPSFAVEEEGPAFPPGLAPPFPFSLDLEEPEDFSAELTRFIEEVHIFKVAVAPQIWRRIAAPARGNLAQLAGAILDAFDFTHDHLYSFLFENRSGISLRVNHPQLGEPLFADQVRVGDLPLQPDDTMTFFYDFGDQWEFLVQLERLEPPDRRRKKPTLLESHGEPPEQYPDWDEY
jgi:hypothetical protein